MIDCERITSKYCVIIPTISRVFPPRYLNYSPRRLTNFLCQILRIKILNNFSVTEAMNYIATYHHLILKSFGESKLQISRLKQNLQFWEIFEIPIIICFYLYFVCISSIATWRRWNFSGKLTNFHWIIYLYILNYFEEFTSKAESLNYSKQLWKNNIHFFLLIWLNSVSLCCIGFCQFWFYITIWQFVNSFWRNSISFIISNVGNQNRSKILTKEHSDST